MNNFAITSAGIGEALQRSASALYSAGNTIDESVALVTAANSVIQNPEQVGTALKTLALRLRGAKTELEEAGLETDNMAESTSTLQAKLKALTHGKVDIMLDADTFKSTTQILREMSAAWEDMTDIERAAALELMGGKRQANILSSVITNFETVEDVIETSMNSSGSAIAENEKWLDSIEGKTYQFTNALQTMWSNMLDSEVIKSFIDFGTDVVQFLDTGAGKVIALVSAFKLMAKFKGFSLGGIAKGLGDTIQNITKAKQTLDALSSVSPVTGTLPTESINAYAKAVAGLTAKQQANLLASQNLTKQDIQRVLQTNQCTEAEIREAMAHVRTKTTKDQEVAASKALFVAKTQEMAATYQNNAATLQGAAADEALTAAKILETAASQNASKADLLEMISKSNLTAGTKQQIIAELGLTSAKKAGEAANYSLKASIDALNSSNPYGWIVIAVSVLITLISLLANADSAFDKVINKAKQAEDSIKSINDKFKEDSKTVKESAERFAELAQGVDILTGKNLSLTTDDYEEFLNLSNKLADIFPTLSRNYDENGNAIVQLTGNVDTIVGSLYNLIDVQKQLANNQILDELPDLYAGVYKKSTKYNNEKGDLERQRDAYNERLVALQGLADEYTIGIEGIKLSDHDDLSGISTSIHDKAIFNAIKRKSEAIEAVLKEAKIKYFSDNFVSYYNPDTDLHERATNVFKIDGWNKMSAEEKESIQKKIDAAFTEIAHIYSSEINNFNDKIQIVANENKANWGSMMSAISTWLSTDSSYQVLNDEMQDVIQQMVNNIDFSSLKGIDTWEKMQEYIQTNIISKLQSATPEVQKAFSQLFKISTKNTNTKDYIEAIQKKAQEIADSSDFTYEEVLKNTGYDGIIQQYQTNAENILKVLDDNIPKYYKRYEEGTTSHLHALQKYSSQVYELKENIYSLSPDEITKAFDIIAKYGIKTWDELQEALEKKTFDVVLDYDKEQTGIEQLLNAIDESISATGLSSESIANLKARYRDLENFDPARLFEETTNGIHLNVQALRELEQAYKEQNKKDLDDKLEGLVEHYNDLTDEIKNCSDAAERSNLYRQRQNVINQINDTATLAAQYAGLTSAYNEWQNVQSGGSERDMYEGILSGRKEIDEELSRGWVDQGTREYLELLSGKDLSTAKYDEVLGVYKELNKAVNSSGYNIYDFFTQDKDGNSTTSGIFNFFDAVKAAQKEVGENWVKVNEKGQYIFDFGEGGDKAVAEALGISEELVQIILRAAQDAGFEVNLDSTYTQLSDLQDDLVKINDRLKELGATEYTFNINSTDVYELDEQITEAQKALKNLKNEDGTLKVGVSEEDYADAQTLLATLIYQKQTLDDSVILKVNVEDPDDGIETIVKKLQDFKSAYNELEVKTAIGADTTEAKQNVDAAIAELNGEDKKILAELGVDLTQSSEKINAAINSITVDDLTVKCGLDKTLIDEYAASEKTTTGEVVWENNIDKVTAWMDQEHTTTGTVEWNNDTSKIPTIFTRKGKIEWDGAVNGTAHSSGTAFSGGSWGAPKTETALVGELGPEMLVRNGRWTTIGEDGAEFRQIKKGDIIFNHKQTEELLSKGYVTGRGKAYAGGTAYSDTDSVGPGRKTVVSASIVGGGDSRLNKAANSVSDAADKFKEVFDWIAVRLEEIGDKIDLKSAKLENEIGYKDQNKTVDKIIDLNNKLYNNLIAGSNKYYAYAEKLLSKVPAEYRKAAQDGTIAIETFVGEADEKTLEAIEEYREWVQKGDEAAQRAEETLTEISNLAKQAIDNVAQDYDNKRSLRDNKVDQYEAYNEFLETDKGFESESIYQAMINENNKIISGLEQQRNKMQTELNKRVESGEIKKYSQDWYDAVNDIAAVDTEIIELKTDTENYQDAINELHWDKFDALMGRIEAVSEEIENMIDILGNNDLVDKNGNWTDEGIASLGLYAQQMEAAEVQAKKYKEEIKYLNKNWQKLGYTEEEYLEKLDELKSGQYDAIQAYHDSKDAIVDLNKERVDAIKNGIEKEIEAYEELIEKKKEELDAEKDLHDFQKSVMDQQKDIADLERQLAALSGDNSASARSKRAQLEADLAEARQALEDTYYDRSISNQQEALDKELENFKDEKDKEIENWEEYLENTNQVVANSLETVKANTDTVFQTLQGMAQEYGLNIQNSITSAIIDPWSQGTTAIQDFSEKFGISMSETIDELNQLELQFIETMATIERSGSDAVDVVKGNVNRYTDAKNQEPKKEVSGGGSSGGNSGGSSTAGMVSSLSGNIRYGNTGDKVKKLQKALNELGFNCGNVDGIFGNKTLAAVKSFQKSSKYGGAIAADGIVGPDTKKKFKTAKYAKGTVGVNKDEWALIDELGEELVLRAKNGRLTYLEKGSGVVPADLTTNLMEWGALDPSMVLDQNRPKIGVGPEIHNTQIQIDNSIAELIHIDHCDKGTLPDVERIVNKAIENHTKKLNQSLRKFTR